MQPFYFNRLTLFGSAFVASIHVIIVCPNHKVSSLIDVLNLGIHQAEFFVCDSYDVTYHQFFRCHNLSPNFITKYVFPGKAPNSSLP